MKNSIASTFATALLVVAASTSSGQETAPPAEPDEPQGAVPSLGFVGPVDGEGNLIVMRTEAKTVQAEETYTFVEDGEDRTGVRTIQFQLLVYVPQAVPLVAVKVFDARGKQLDEAAVRKAIARDTLVLTTPWGLKVDPAYLQIVNENALVVEQMPPVPQKGVVLPVPQDAPTTAPDSTAEVAPSPPPTPAPAAPTPGPAEAPGDSRHPPTMPPSIVWIDGLGEAGELTLLRPVCETREEIVTETIKEADGRERQVSKKVLRCVMKLVPETSVLKEPMVFALKQGTHGDQISAADARKLLKRPQPVLIAYNGTPDDRYLSIFRDGTPIVILESSPAAPAEAQAQGVPDVIAPSPAPAPAVAPPTVPRAPAAKPTAKPVEKARRPDERQVQKFRSLAESHYNRGEYNDAVEALRSAIEQDPSDPAMYYLLAYIQHRAGQMNDAEQSAKTAATLEAQRPIGNWGKLMERYQGASRHWLETGRS